MPKPREYRLIVVKVSAWRVTKDNAEHIAQWCGGLARETIDPCDPERRIKHVNVPTLDGLKFASEGDYVVKHASGQFEVMGPHQFEMQYEAITTP